MRALAWPSSLSLRLRGGTRRAFATAVVMAVAASGCGGAGGASPVARDGARPAETIPSLPLRGELPDFDLPLSVAEAYAAIPHRRTVFRFAGAALPAAESAYLEVVFHLLDQGTRVRVTAYRDLYHRGASDHQPVAKLTRLLEVLDGIEPPSRLVGYHRHVVRAIAAERAFVDEWRLAGAAFAYRERPELATHPQVQTASQELQAAYRTLMDLYGERQSAANRDALFDVHCAFDFL